MSLLSLCLGEWIGLLEGKSVYQAKESPPDATVYYVLPWGATEELSSDPQVSVCVCPVMVRRQEPSGKLMFTQGERIERVFWSSIKRTGSPIDEKIMTGIGVFLINRGRPYVSPYSH